MGLQEEMRTYLEEAEQELDGFESDLESFFSSLETRETGFSREMASEMESDAFSTYEWGPRTATNSAQRSAREKYERWYTAVEPVVYGYLPRRYEEFADGHEKVIKGINLDTGLTDSAPEEPIAKAIEIIDIVDSQRSVVGAAPNRVAAERFNVRESISANIEQTEIERAKQLFQDELIREAGVIAGVALERHLLTMCETSERDVEFNPEHSIERLAQSLYEADVIGNTKNKLLAFLGGVRGDCAHPGDDPDRNEVEQLVIRAEEIIQDGFDGHTPVSG